MTVRTDLPAAPAPLPRPALLVPLLQAALLAVLPAGGQRTARRNAWAGRSEDAARSRTRRDAERALAAASARTAGVLAARG